MCWEPNGGPQVVKDDAGRTKEQRAFLRIARLIRHDILDCHTPDTGYIWALIDRLLRRAKASRADL